MLGVAAPPHPLVCTIWNFWSYVSPIHFQDIVSKKSEREYLNKPVSLLGLFGDDLDWFCIEGKKKGNHRGGVGVLPPPLNGRGCKKVSKGGYGGCLHPP